MMPWMIPITVTALMFKFIFGTDVGILNYILKSLGLISQNIDWLTSSGTAMLALIVANVWIGIPFNMILISTGLTTIPTELYKAHPLTVLENSILFSKLRFRCFARRLSQF